MKVRLCTLLAAMWAAGVSVMPAEAGPGEVPAPVAEAAKQAAPGAPNEVVVGVYINDIQELDFRTHSYAVDLYVWLRWRNAELDPGKSLEFMNRYASSDHVRENLYEKPKVMPDGSFYTVIRNQGRFSTKFRLDKYPFDTQKLLVLFEDAISPAFSFVYVPDKTPVTINPDVSMPGFKLGAPALAIVTSQYPTDFGDLAEPDNPSYSRVTLSMPVSRPLVALSAKTFVPILLVLVCAALVFFVRPAIVDGRVALAITALLTLVALQLTGNSSLPEVDYLMMLDKIYFLSYGFIVAALVRVAMTSWTGANTEREKKVAAADRRWAAVLTVLYVAAVAAVAWATLAPEPTLAQAGAAL